ncbi:MAG: InlB B-repeat-containing protein, partial [Bacilli bacterium]|nr:InlB B-repeat-containing protein [Bacilli bacterium]
AVPFKEGAKFAGWFTDSGLTQSLEGATITSRMTVYAKWE